MKSQTLRRRLGTVSLLFVVLAAVVWYLSVESEEQADAGRVAHKLPVSFLWKKLQRAAHARPSSTKSQEAEFRAYEVMRSPPERMTPQMAVHVTDTLGPPPGALRFGSTQYTSTAIGGVWIVSGPHIVCIVQAGPGAITCGTAADFVKNGLVIGVAERVKLSSKSDHKFMTLGVAPDTATSVRVKVGQTIRTVPVQRNSYGLRAGEIIKVVSLNKKG